MTKNIDIFILCGGKSGSSSLYSSFIKNNYNTLKIHGKLDYIEQFNEDKLYETINISSAKKPVFIIDVYRTPIERKISSFFQNIDSYLPNWQCKSIEQLITKFNNKYLYELEEYHSINEAFDYYDIPYFKEFDFKKKFNLFKKNNLIFIKLLYKNINEWHHILRVIFNKQFIITKDNMSSYKNYYKTYQHFLLMYKIPKKYLNILTKDREFLIYNTLEDQVSYFEYWNSKSF